MRAQLEYVVPAAAPPVPKMAERVRLRRAGAAHQPGDMSTAAAERLVGSVLRAACDEDSIGPEQRLTARLDHARAQNAVLALTLEDARAQCERLALLCAKYESNAVALQVALRLADRAIEAYDVLVALLETAGGTAGRAAAEGAARRVLGAGADADGLRVYVSRLKRERATVQGTCVRLESTHAPPAPVDRPQHENRRTDIETAVLLQEMMGLREERAELVARVSAAERQRDEALAGRRDRPPTSL